jgi:hypothetical protein
VNGKSAAERAFELADEGLLVQEIRAKLMREGFSATQVYGWSMVNQLRARGKAAREKISAADAVMADNPETRNDP